LKTTLCLACACCQASAAEGTLRQLQAQANPEETRCTLWVPEPAACIINYLFLGFRVIYCLFRVQGYLFLFRVQGYLFLGLFTIIFRVQGYDAGRYPSQLHTSDGF
jgi:hypothetical protein